MDYQTAGLLADMQMEVDTETSGLRFVCRTSESVRH